MYTDYKFYYMDCKLYLEITSYSIRMTSITDVKHTDCKLYYADYNLY